MVDFFTGLQPLEPGETDPGRLIERIRALDTSQAIDRVLVGYSSIWPHNHATAPYMLALTQKFSPIVAHRPGVMAPVAAARYFATLDVLAAGRLAINVVVGGSDKDLHRESDHTPKAERYDRAIDYLDSEMGPCRRRRFSGVTLPRLTLCCLGQDWSARGAALPARVRSGGVT
jgi:alkanesulfonate monooxygenase